MQKQSKESEIIQKLLQPETGHDFTSIDLYGTAVYENGGDHCASFHYG